MVMRQYSFILILCKKTAIFAEKDSEDCKSSSHCFLKKKIAHLIYPKVLKYWDT